jgi:hypothetical protein
MNAGSFPGCPPVMSAWYDRVDDQLADHETVVELGRHGDVTSAALSHVGSGQRRGSSV